MEWIIVVRCLDCAHRTRALVRTKGLAGAPPQTAQHIGVAQCGCHCPCGELWEGLDCQHPFDLKTWGPLGIWGAKASSLDDGSRSGGGHCCTTSIHIVLVNWSQLLVESFWNIEEAQLHAGLFVKFKHEEATGLGVMREWFCLVCHALFHLRALLFSACPQDRRRFFLNPSE